LHQFVRSWCKRLAPVALGVIGSGSLTGLAPGVFRVEGPRLRTDRGVRRSEE
jgi:hypothetical protein